MKLKTTIFIKCLTLWNWLTDSVNSVKSKVSNFYSHILLYFRKDNNLWYIMEDYNVPFKSDMLYNVKPDWVYDISKNRLYRDENMENNNELVPGWLSTKLVKDDKEEDMDTFFSNLSIVTNENKLPSMNIILMAWSIYKKHWYVFDESFTLHIIDDKANDIQLSYSSQYVRSPFKINKNKLYFL